MSDIDVPEAMDTYVDPDHIDMVMEGLIDTVTGTEGMSLTNAQIYLNGVMRANGVIPYHEVAGNEGIFKSIGEGLQKIWEYIKSLFRKIFGGEKKKDAEAATQKLDTSIKKAEEKVKQVESPPVQDIKTVEDLDKFMGVAEKKVKQAPESPIKKELDKEFAEVRESIEKLKVQAKEASKPMPPPTPQQKEEVKKIIAKSFEASIYDKSKSTEASGRLKHAVEALQTLKAEYEKTEDQLNMAVCIQTYINGLGGLGPVEAISTIQGASAWMRTAKRCKEAMGNNWVDIFNTKMAIEKEIQELEGKINHYDKSDSQDKLKQDIKDLQADLVGIVKVDGLMSRVTWEINIMVDNIDKACIEIKD